MPDGKRMDYGKFMLTDYWKQVRQLVLDRDGHKCTKCGSKKVLQVHHLTYDHHFNEHKHLKDLITLCKICHEDTHGLPHTKAKRVIIS